MKHFEVAACVLAMAAEAFWFSAAASSPAPRLVEEEAEVTAVEFALPPRLTLATALDFSGVEPLRRCDAKVVFYTDSLFARFLDGAKETLRLSREGDILLAAVEDRVKIRRIVSDALWLPATLRQGASVCDEVSDVAGSDMAGSPAMGHRSASAARVGRLIFAEGDTVAGAVAVTIRSEFGIAGEADTASCVTTATRIYADGYSWPLFETRSAVIRSAGVTDSAGVSYLCPPSAQTLRPDIAYRLEETEPRIRSPRNPSEGGFPLTLPLDDPNTGTTGSATLAYDSGTVIVSVTAVGDFSASVCDVAGRVYARGDSGGADLRLDCASLPHSIYIISVTTPAAIASVKVPLPQ